MIEESLNKNTCMNVDKITLGIGKKKKNCISQVMDKVTNNRDEVINVSKKFYRKLHIAVMIGKPKIPAWKL